MEIIDNVYGKEKFNEPVLIDLINSKPVQRLKGISQMGLPQEYYHKKVYSRYEHSLGVLILLRKLNAGIKEQIAGLLHDVSHTAFSHVIDWTLGDPTKEDYQDKNHFEIISNSEIPLILKNYGFNYEEISKPENFSLLEKEAPSLCADRIDYSLRELSFEESPDLIEGIFLNLVNINGQIAFKNKKSAELFGNKYSILQRESWGGNEARARYYILSSVLKNALKKEIIQLEDLMKTDNEVIQLLTCAKDGFISDKLNLLKRGFTLKESSEGVELKKKFRYVNPEVLINGNVFSLEEVSPEYKKLIDSEKENAHLSNKILIIPK